MSNEFWLGLYYGVIAGALPLVALMCWVLNRRVQRHIASQTAIPAPPVAGAAGTVPSLSDEDRAILEAVHRELDDEHRGNAPGHAHEVVGIWDSDNGEKAGKPCAWCLTWRKFTALIRANDAATLPLTPPAAGTVPIEAGGVLGGPVGAPVGVALPDGGQ